MTDLANSLVLLPSKSLGYENWCNQNTKWWYEEALTEKKNYIVQKSLTRISYKAEGIKRKPEI